MGRAKPRTNKRAPPKPSRPVTAAPGQPTSNVDSKLALTQDAASRAVTSLLQNRKLPENATQAEIDQTIEGLAYALQNFSTSPNAALDLPKHTQAQLRAIAGAAAGIDPGTGVNGEGLPFDLPKSLAALLEAKLTLDREKAKLLKMQQELKGYRDEVAAATVVKSHGKGKEVAVNEDDLGVCTCGQQHALSDSAEVYETDQYYSDGDYDCEDCCDCSCHFVECDHDHDEDCDCGYDDEVNGHEHHHHHHHQHHHHHHDDDEFQHDHDHEHIHDHHDHHDHHHHHHIHDHDHGHGVLETDLDQSQAITIPNPYLPQNGDLNANMTYQQALESYRDERDAAARGLDEIGGMFKAAGWAGPRALAKTNGDDGSRKPLSEDPERLDEAVRELFGWIKAVVWTIEQAAVVSGRKSWPAKTAS